MGRTKSLKKCLDKLDSNLCPLEINIKFLEQIIKLNKPQEVTVAHIEETKNQIWPKRAVVERFRGQERKKRVFQP